MPNEFEDTDTEVFEVSTIPEIKSDAKTDDKSKLGPEFDSTCKIVSVVGNEIKLNVIPPESTVCSLSTIANHIASDVALALGLLNVECGGMSKDGDKWVLPISGKLPPTEPAV